MIKASAYILVLATVALAASPAAAEKQRVSAHLTGSAETPGPGDPDGAGHANIDLDAGEGMVCTDLTVEKVGAATMAHIHKAAAGAAGPPVVTLATPDAAGKSKSCVKADAQVVADILNNPADYYVNVHNAEFPAGAVRGQLTK